MPKYTNRYLRLYVKRPDSERVYTFDESWKIVYRIRKSASADILSFNLAEISVYNMTSELRETLSSKNCSIKLDVGYAEFHNVIFNGRVNNITTVKQTTELITTFYCQSDMTAYTQNVQICVQNVTVTDLLAQLCDEYGVSYRLPFKRPDIVKQSYTGPFSKVISLICHDYGISYAIDNGQLLFRDKNMTEDEILNTGVKVFTPNSGILGNPTVTEVGIKFKALMQSDIKVNDYFRLYAPYADYNLNALDTAPNRVVGNELNALAHIDTKTYNGSYMALSLIFTGDTRGNSWFTEIEGSRVWAR